MEFTIKRNFPATAKQIYDTWLDSTGHTKMTGGAATASTRIGGSFTAWDGYISGKNVILDENKRIVQSWRTAQFEDHEADSQIEIRLREKEGITELTLNHTCVPESGEHYIKGWDEHYFQPMKAYFSKK